MKIGIDLLWVRPGVNGGTESFIRNVLDGLLKYPNVEERYYLYTSEDNADSFDKYLQSEYFVKRVCKVKTSSNVRRVLWENTHINAVSKNDDIDVWFMPVYSRPLFLKSSIPCVTSIMDLQALHYPEYFGAIRKIYFSLMWWWDCRFSDHIVTISDFCKQDIINHYPFVRAKISTIYTPITLSFGNETDFSIVKEKYKVEDGGFFYTVSSLDKHKNLMTLIKAVKALKESGENSIRLLITGVNFNKENEVIKYIAENDLMDNIQHTGFISNEERDCLYKHCRAFLFPSTFEGFGMPPVEAMKYEATVVTTKKTALYEVTQGKALYVENPFNVDEWKQKMIEAQSTKVNYSTVDFERYSLLSITSKYREIFRSLYRKKVK